MTALPFQPRPPVPMNGAAPPAAPPAAPQMQQPPAPPPPEPVIQAPRQQTWAQTWKRPDDWTDEKLLAKFSAWDRTDKTHWSDWRTDAKLCYDVTAGRQWDKDAEQDAKDKSLTIVSINKVDSTVSAICGSEMTNRQEVRYYPRETSTKGPDGQRQDIVVNEILTAAAEWVRDECDAADEESEAFRDVIICGLGCTETSMSYDIDPDGMGVVQRCDPLEFRLDAAARRPNAIDARRIAREKAFPKDEARDRFGIEGEFGDNPSTRGGEHSNNPGEAYQGDDSEMVSKDDVLITEYQWWELERLHRVVNSRTGQIEELTQEDYDRAYEAGLVEDSATVKIRRHYRAFRCADRLLEVTALPDEEFTYKFITGKLDRNKGVWYGVVKAMIDPQRLLNKQISQIQRIIDTNAKGGLLAEADAFEDPEQAQDDWAASDSIIWMKNGAVAGHKVIPKPISQYPSGLDRLLMVANEAVPGVSGVNNEMLGVIDREQAGVVDVQRKEAAYGVLKSFFNSLRRYRRMHGRHLLKLISKYMTDGRLVRIIGRTGAVQYIPLIRQPDTLRFDVIVDEAPTGPNQKDRVFSFMVAMMPLLRSMNLPPQIMLKLLEYSPLPTSLISEVQEEVKKIPPQADPNAQKLQAEQQATQAKLQMEGQKAQSDAQLRQAEAQANIQIEQMKAQLMAQTERQKADMQAEQAARQAQIDAAVERMKAERQAQVEAEKMDRQMALEQWKAQQDQMMAERQFAFEARLQQVEMAFNQKLAEKQADAKAATGTQTRFGGDVG